MSCDQCSFHCNCEKLILTLLASCRASAILDTIERIQSSKSREVSGNVCFLKDFFVFLRGVFLVLSSSLFCQVIALEFSERLKHYQDVSLLNRNLQVLLCLYFLSYLFSPLTSSLLLPLLFSSLPSPLTSFSRCLSPILSPLPPSDTFSFTPQQLRRCSTCELKGCTQTGRLQVRNVAENQHTHQHFSMNINVCMKRQSQHTFITCIRNIHP